MSRASGVMPVIYNNFKLSIDFMETVHEAKSSIEEEGRKAEAFPAHIAERVADLDVMLHNERQRNETALEYAAEHYRDYSETYHTVALAEASQAGKTIEFSGSVATRVVALTD